MVLRRWRLFRHPERTHHDDRRRLCDHPWAARRRRAATIRSGSFQRSSALARRRVLALQTSGRNAPLLLRAAARNLSAGRAMRAAAGAASAMLAGAAGACYLSPMPALILPLIEVMAYLPVRGALIGLDLGTKTIGVASSDPDRRLATGVETIARKNFSADAARLLVLAAERQAAAFVLGLPVNMDGTEGPRAQSTRAFARNLARLTQLPIALWDERLSTAAVERELIAANVTRARRAKVIDQHAAVFILQGALDRLARGVMAHGSPIARGLAKR